jgi:hypothetical protein
MGKRDIDGQVYYFVDRLPTLVPKRSLRSTKDLLGEFETRLQGRSRLGQCREVALGSRCIQWLTAEETVMSAPEAKVRLAVRQPTYKYGFPFL